VETDARPITLGGDSVAVSVVRLARDKRLNAVRIEPSTRRDAGRNVEIADRRLIETGRVSRCSFRSFRDR